MSDILREMRRLLTPALALFILVAFIAVWAGFSAILYLAAYGQISIAVIFVSGAMMAAIFVAAVILNPLMVAACGRVKPPSADEVKRTTAEGIIEGTDAPLKSQIVEAYLVNFLRMQQSPSLGAAVKYVEAHGFDAGYAAQIADEMRQQGKIIYHPDDREAKMGDIEVEVSREYYGLDSEEETA